SSQFLDGFLDKDEILTSPAILEKVAADAILFIFPDCALMKLAAQARIPHRVATSHNLCTWRYCNLRVSFSRKKSDLHEAQLNFRLLRPLGWERILPLAEIPKYYGLQTGEQLNEKYRPLLHPDKFNLIVHPKSKGSAHEWQLSNYETLCKSLDAKQYQIFITGVASEGEAIKAEIPHFFEAENIIDLTGQMDLKQLIAFINQADGLFAGSTGPLHISAALGRNTLGIYQPMRPAHPGRWQPLGAKADYLVLDKICSDCRKQTYCACINQLSVAQVQAKIENWHQKKFS
ncbi:MAG: glycosyltransferase family 9 protein, partial [Bacteroidota bacterium]